MEPTDDDRTENDEGDNDLQSGCKEFLLVLGRVVRDLEFGEGQTRDKYRSYTHLGNRLVNTPP